MSKLQFFLSRPHISRVSGFSSKIGRILTKSGRPDSEYAMNNFYKNFYSLHIRVETDKRKLKNCNAVLMRFKRQY